MTTHYATCAPTMLALMNSQEYEIVWHQIPVLGVESRRLKGWFIVACSDKTMHSSVEWRAPEGHLYVYAYSLEVLPKDKKVLEIFNSLKRIIFFSDRTVQWGFSLRSAVSINKISMHVHLLGGLKSRLKVDCLGWNTIGVLISDWILDEI